MRLVASPGAAIATLEKTVEYSDVGEQAVRVVLHGRLDTKAIDEIPMPSPKRPPRPERP